MYNNLPIIELRETEVKGGYLYEAIENGEVVATRKAVRRYVAALIDSSKKIANGIGKENLISQALKTSYSSIRAIALTPELMEKHLRYQKTIEISRM